MKQKSIYYYSFVLFLFLLLTGNVSSQHEHDHGQEYCPVSDPLVKEKLEKWQDIKFGLFMHWGIYCEEELMASWHICNEEWVGRRKMSFENYDLFKQEYWDLRKRFNPVDFYVEKWVKAAKNAGMKYMVFTTKHHDGFCMFDTKTTDFKITGKDVPFSKNPRANITKELFNAFQKENFMIGAYFSKPDWNCPDYWWPYYATPDRHVNYDPAKFPEKWQKYKDHTFTQVEELMTGYGKVDILWLDGAWVRPIDNMPEKFKDWALKNDWDQNVDIPRIAKMAREHQPGLIVTDRWVSGEYENYLTPENRVPEEAIKVPWESCITAVNGGWAYNSRAKYKSVRQLVHMLTEVVSKGGNLLLNFAPSPKGDWKDGAYKVLEGIGDWMKINSEAIYETRAIKPYKEAKICLTKKKDTNVVYAIYLGDEDETYPPSKIWLSSIQPTPEAKIRLLGFAGDLKWEKVGKGFLVDIPDAAQNNPPCKHAWTIKISEIKNSNLK